MSTMSNTFKAGIMIVLITIAYLFGVTFTPEQYVNELFANRIITYFQTIITAIICYYWGASTKSQGTIYPPDNTTTRKETTQATTTTTSSPTTESISETETNKI